VTGRLLTLAETADRLGCSVKTLRRRIATGALPAFKDGGLVRVPERALAAYVSSRTGKAMTVSPPSARPAVAGSRTRRALRPGRTLFDVPDPL
jgi:excisionase family DNA binding protein